MTEFLEESNKGELERLWHGAVLQRMDAKKFPRRPEQLWDPDAADQSVEQMKALAIAWASNGTEIMRATKH